MINSVEGLGEQRLGTLGGKQYVGISPFRGLLEGAFTGRSERLES